jgi:hypothetical protein
MGEHHDMAWLETLSAEASAAMRETAERFHTALATLHAAGEQFATYAEQHMAKGTPEADAKAEVNRGWAIRCFDACNAVAFFGGPTKPLIIYGESRSTETRRPGHD